MQASIAMSKDKVILAYSGGLDTSCILKWLLEKNYEVICYMANIGQDEDFEAARQKAKKLGATDIVIDDLRKQFVEEYVWPAIRAGLIYENRYLLGTSLARPCIAVGLIACAKNHAAKYISHGATGKGNDQIRFELSAYYLCPEIRVIAPWRDAEFCAKFQGRQDLLEYASKHGIPVSVTPKAPWSMDANLMHISYESGILENPNTEPPQDLFMMTQSPVKNKLLHPMRFTIEFDSGCPKSLQFSFDKTITDPLEMFLELNRLGGQYGIGRIDIVENRYVGLKSRGVYETPAGYILHVAQQDLEVFCLDKEVFRVKHQLMLKMADYVYNGFWFSPEGNYVGECLKMAAKNVTGSVNIEIIPGSVIVLGRKSNFSTYNENLVSMDKHDDFSPQDATGFINIQAIRLKEYKRKMQN